MNKDRDKYMEKGRGRERDSDESEYGQKRERFIRKRACRFCEEPKLTIDFKDAKALIPFINERGKILPRRITNNCAYHQRKVTTAIKRARMLALLPYTSTHAR